MVEDGALAPEAAAAHARQNPAIAICDGKCDKNGQAIDLKETEIFHRFFS
jgi:hypothetical protein